MKITLDDNVAELEIEQIDDKKKISYLTDKDETFKDYIGKSGNIFYFKALKLNIPKDINYIYIEGIIKKYNEQSEIKINPTKEDIENLKKKANINYSFSSTIDKELMKKTIKEFLIDPKYKNVTYKLFKKVIDDFKIGTTDLLFAESAISNHPDLMLYNNFYLSTEERSMNLLENFYKKYLEFASFEGLGTYDTYKSIKLIEILEPFNIIYITGEKLVNKIKELASKIKYLKYKNKYLNLKNLYYGGADLEYGIGIENEFAFMYGEIEVKTGEQFLIDISRNGIDNFNKVFTNPDTIKDQIRGLKEVRVIEIVNLDPISYIFYEDESFMDSNLKQITLQGLKMFNNASITTLPRIDEIYTGGNINSLLQISPPEETAYLSVMWELATKKYESPNIDNIENEITWKRNYALILLRKIIQKRSKDIWCDYYASKNLKVYDNEPFDFIKVKCFKYDAFSGMDNGKCREYEYLFTKDYLASLHFNITLPRVNLKVPLSPEEKDTHKIVVKFIQLFAPVLIANYGVQDFSYGKFGRLTNGSFRMLHSKTIGINSIDSDLDIPTNRQYSNNIIEKPYNLFYKPINNLNLVNSFDYNFLGKYFPNNEPDTSFNVGYDFRRSIDTLGFEYRLMDYCKISCIKTIIRFIFLLLKFIDHKQINLPKCKAINNDIINNEILNIFTSVNKQLSEPYKKLVYECSGFYDKSINPKEYFSKLYTYLIEIPTNIKYKKLFEKLKINEINF
jgi:hypothetical protein